MKNIPIILFLSIFLGSCATFKPATEIKYLPNSTLENINGKFDGESLIYSLDRKLLFNTLILDTLKFYKVELNLLSPKRLEAIYYADDIIFDIKSFKVKSKNDDFLYLKNKNTKFVLIPYLLGRIDIQRARLAINEDGDLVFDASTFTNGAGLFVIGLHAKSDGFKFIAKRIEK